MSERNRKRIRQKNTPQKQESKTNEKKDTEPIDDDEEKNPQKSQKKQVPKNKNIETLKNEEENENDEMDEEKIEKVENNNKTNGKNTKKKNDQKNGKNVKKNDDDDEDDDDEDDRFTNLKKEDFEENNFNNEENDDEMLNEKEVVKLPFEKENDDEQLFSSLDIHENTMKSIQEMGFTKMTNIQAAAIPDALKGRDISGSAHTGSGKTLAFIIPAVELLVKAKFKPRNGTGVIILSPTRELSIQSYQVSRELLKYHEQKTVSLIMGGNDRDTEEEKLLKGSNIVIGTPGRILDHLKNTKGFLIKNLKMLIFDEADRLLDSGFEEEIIQILSFLPKKRQTLLFSATQSENVEHLAKLSLRKGLKEIHIDKQKQLATVEGLEQGYIVCDSDARFLLLFTFLKRNLKKKIIVFFSSCDSVKFHTDLLNYVDISVLSLHGKQKQKKRSKTFFEFKNTDKGILLSTDVAARGLDIPGVDWIVQFDPPDEPTDYIHRVGRTARGIDGKGKALLFLLPSELKFLQFLKQSKVKLEEYEFPKNKIANVQSQLEKLVSNNYYLNKAAQEAYRGYLLSYASHHLKEVYNVHDLDLQKIAKSLGLQVPPKISINISMTNKSTRAIPRHTKKRTRKSFNDDKTTKKRRMNEKRQFVV